MTSPVRLTHVKVSLALHQLAGGSGRPLLLLHGLGERTPVEVPLVARSWPGPVWGLDFTGHGASDIPAGGGYTAEVLMADASTALDHLGEATVLGRGLGAYIALLLAGARPTEVKGAVLADGPGLAGGGTDPGSPYVLTLPTGLPTPPDPFVLAELAHDLRPPDYAASFATQAAQLSDLAQPISVACRSRPEWVVAVLAVPGVGECEVEQALEAYCG